MPLVPPYIIVLDHQLSAKDLADFTAELWDLSEGTDRLSESTWVIVSVQAGDYIYERLRPFTGPAERLHVALSAMPRRKGWWDRRTFAKALSVRRERQRVKPLFYDDDVLPERRSKNPRDRDD